MRYSPSNVSVDCKVGPRHKQQTAGIKSVLRAKAPKANNGVHRLWISKAVMLVFLAAASAASMAIGWRAFSHVLRDMARVTDADWLRFLSSI